MKTYVIKVHSHFSAAHNLRGYKGKCEQLHGHNWKAQVSIASFQLNKLDMVCDFKEVKEKLDKVLAKLDHNYLNKLPYFKKNNPTSEKIAEFIYYGLKKLVKDKNISLKEVCVWETQTQQASFSEDDI